MIKKIKRLFCLVAAFLPLAGAAQGDSTTVSLPDLKVTAKLDGTIKTKLETALPDGVMRFNVRNSRIGVRGGIGDYIDYRIQVELSNEGTFSPLDLFATIRPCKGLYFNFGQTSIPFDNSYVITPAEMMFANRAFVGKFFTPGSRDIGMVAGWKFRLGELPMEAQAGVFNGGKINNPQWTDHPSFAARLIAGQMTGWRSSVKVYRYRGEVLDQTMVGADVRYADRRMRIEAEVMNRHSNGTGRNLLGAYLQGSYAFPLKRAGLFHYISPAARWDAMGYAGSGKAFDVNRLTGGINFGLTPKRDGSVIRIDYEHYMLREGMDFVDFEDRDPHVADDKVTIELLIRF